MKAKLTEFFAGLVDRLRTRPSEQLTAQHVRWVVWTILIMWYTPVVSFSVLMAIPSLALAAAPAAAHALDQPLNVSIEQLALAVLLSSCGGGTALLIRIDRELSQAKQRSVPHMLIFCASHMCGGWLAGALAFLLARAGDFDVWNGLILVLVASFTGAKFVEMVAERVYSSKLPPGMTPPASGV